MLYTPSFIRKPFRQQCLHYEHFAPGCFKNFGFIVQLNGS